MTDLLSNARLPVCSISSYELQNGLEISHWEESYVMGPRNSRSRPYIVRDLCLGFWSLQVKGAEQIVTQWCIPMIDVKHRPIRGMSWMLFGQKISSLNMYSIPWLFCECRLPCQRVWLCDQKVYSSRCGFWAIKEYANLEGIYLSRPSLYSNKCSYKIRYRNLISEPKVRQKISEGLSENEKGAQQKSRCLSQQRWFIASSFRFVVRIPRFRNRGSIYFNSEEGSGFLSNENCLLLLMSLKTSGSAMDASWETEPRAYKPRDATKSIKSINIGLEIAEQHLSIFPAS